MFANRLRLILREKDGERLVPKGWLDQFFMRNFTGYSAFDETLPVADGELETARSVNPEDIRDHFEKWLRGRKLIAQDASLLVSAQED